VDETETSYRMDPTEATADLAICERITYGAACDRALRGDYGTPERIGSRLFIRLASSERPRDAEVLRLRA
jgi:hypothetical protein